MILYSSIIVKHFSQKNFRKNKLFLRKFGFIYFSNILLLEQGG